MKLRTIIISVVVAGASIVSVAAYSHRHSTPEEHASHVVERLTNKLELSSEWILRASVKPVVMVWACICVE